MKEKSHQLDSLGREKVEKGVAHCGEYRRPPMQADHWAWGQNHAPVFRWDEKAIVSSLEPQSSPPPPARSGRRTAIVARPVLSVTELYSRATDRTLA